VKNILTTTLAVAALGMAAPVLAQETSAAPAAAPASAPAPAAEAAAAKAGDTVYDQAGEVVGTIEKVEGTNFVISTGTNSATLSLSVLGHGPKGHVIGLTKAQLDEAIVKAQGAAAPAAEAPPQQ
jgi:hypothetical protein